MTFLPETAALVQNRLGILRSAPSTNGLFPS